MLRKIYRPGKPIHWEVVEKETVDEIIFRTTKVRNRLILELMARGGMRIGEVLQLTPNDVGDHKLMIQSPKSGRDAEVVFIPRKVADRLRSYLKDKAIAPEHKIFPITYAAARIIVKNAGKLAGIELRPHDSEAACRHVCVEIWGSHRNREQGDPASLKPFHHATISREDQRQ